MAKQNNFSEKKKKQPRIFSLKRMLLLVWGIFMIGVLSVFLLFWVTSKGWLGEMPDVQELENPDIYVSSEIYSSDGVLLDRFETEKRIPISYKELPENLVNALLARE
ncbi:MAG: peptidoglycan glycosyltransferase, partial [Weeksellaceae bacterium]